MNDELKSLKNDVKQSEENVKLHLSGLVTALKAHVTKNGYVATAIIVIALIAIEVFRGVGAG